VREDSRVARKNDRDRRDGDEKRIDVACHFLPCWCEYEQGHAEVDEHEVLRELCKHDEYVFRRASGATGYGVVSVVFECDAAEEKRDDAGCEALRELVANIRNMDDKAESDRGIEV
jgi:hypothetical protein